jgi:hypothetical protein
MNDRFFYTLGQVGGYASGLAAYFNLVKDVVGFLGIVAGAALSLWALWDRIQKHRREKAEKASAE